MVLFIIIYSPVILENNIELIATEIILSQKHSNDIVIKHTKSPPKFIQGKVLKTTPN